MQDQQKNIPEQIKDIMAKEMYASEKVELIKKLDARPQTSYGPYVNACINMADLKINSQDMGKLRDDERGKVADLYINRNKGTMLGDVGMAIPRVVYNVVSNIVLAVFALGTGYAAMIANGAAKNYHREEADNQINNQLKGGDYRYSAHETVTIQKASKYYNISDKNKTLYQKATEKSEKIIKLVHKELDKRKEGGKHRALS